MKAPAPVLLSARGLGRKFGGLVAVADLDIEVCAGEVLGVIGPNGAGQEHNVQHDRGRVGTFWRNAGI